MEGVFNSVTDNCKMLDAINNWAILQYLEAYYTKMKLPKIKTGLKVSKELQLFK